LFAQKFAFSLPARVNFVGGGGKTSLILALMEEYSQTLPVVYTTTTRFHPPHPTDGLVIISSNNDAYLSMLLERAVASWCCGRRFVVTRLPSGPHLLSGVDPAFSTCLDRAVFPLIFNEADGARSMSLKMPRAGEPVLMCGAEYLVPVIGLDCLNQALGPKTLFRWDLAPKKLQRKSGTLIDPELAASILLHPQGVCKDWQPGMRIIPFINKVDTDAQEDAALALATALLNNGTFTVDRVVWGSIHGARSYSLDRKSAQ
jgi:probable selenium-dependent hydroxylase accessory protein YqeC